MKYLVSIETQRGTIVRTLANEGVRWYFTVTVLC